MRELRSEDRPIRRVIIAGGGNIGLRLAGSLEQDLRVKVIERDPQRAGAIAAQLNQALVLCGDATDENLLETENIDEMDMFIALTNDEEDNIMSASLAKRMGAHRTLALIKRRSYVDLVQGGRIDIAISPAQASIGSLLAHVRRGDVIAVHSLRRGAAEALEIIAHGDPKTSKVVGHDPGALPAQGRDDRRGGARDPRGRAARTAPGADGPPRPEDRGRGPGRGVLHRAQPGQAGRAPVPGRRGIPLRCAAIFRSSAPWG